MAQLLFYMRVSNIIANYKRKCVQRRKITSTILFFKIQCDTLNLRTEVLFYLHKNKIELTKLNLIYR